MSKLIVGCGYLGRRVARRWVAAGEHIAALTRSEENAALLREIGVTSIVGDVLAPETLRDLPDCETLLYAVGRDRNQPHSMHDIYVGGLQNVLRALAGRVKRLIYISSTSVYGQSAGEIVDETSVCEPVAENGQVCLKAERIAREFGRAGGTEIVVLRLAGIYGPGRLISRVTDLKAAKPLGGNPDAWLNLIHVEDAADAVLQVEQCNENLPTYLVCDNRPVRRREYYAKLAELVGAPEPVFEKSPVGGLNKRCDNRTLREQTGWSPRFGGIDKGLADAVG